MGVMARHRHSANLRLCGGVWIQERRGETGTIQEGKAARYALAALMKKYDAGEKGH